MADYKIINNITPQQGIEMITIQNLLVNTSRSNYSTQTQHVVPQTAFEASKTLLLAQAEKIILKKSQKGIFSVMAYFIKFGFKSGCFIKQANYAIQLKKFGYKALRRQQVGIICAKLVELGLVKRIQRHRRAPYEYSLTNLGEAYYEVQNPGYQKQAERRRDDWPDEKKPYIENNKNRTSQLRSSFNKTSYSNFKEKRMNYSTSEPVRPPIQSERRQEIEKEARRKALEALKREGVKDPALTGLKVDYDDLKRYSERFEGYVYYYRNQMSMN